MSCRVCVVQIQPRKRVLDRADCMAPTRQHEQIRDLPAVKDLDHGVGIDHTDDLSDM